MGQGLLEQGVADFMEYRGGEGSQQGRKESGQTHSATVAGQHLAYIASCAMFLCFIQTKLGLNGSR